MGPAIKDEVPEIVDQTRYAGLGNVLLRYKDKVFFENRANAVDPSFLQMLTFPLLSGSPETALSEPNSIVISEEIANLTAWPLAYLLMRSWLQKFAYRMDLGMDIFIISGLLTFGVTLLTVSFQSIKVALANPVKALRYE